MKNLIIKYRRLELGPGANHNIDDKHIVIFVARLNSDFELYINSVGIFEVFNNSRTCLTGIWFYGSIRYPGSILSIKWFYLISCFWFGKCDFGER